MHLLLNTLRKLDCYRLQLSDISGTEIGRAVATVADHHPRAVGRCECQLPAGMRRKRRGWTAATRATHALPHLASPGVLQEVSKLASALLHKWQAQFDAALFSCMEYDTAAAAAAPEGDPSDFKLQAPPPPPPPPPEAPTRVQPSRKDRATRFREEADYLDGSDFEGISESESEAPSDDDDWQPGQRRRASGSAALNSKKARQ
jgi:hypothetical protein